MHSLIIGVRLVEAAVFAAAALAKLLAPAGSRGAITALGFRDTDAKVLAPALSAAELAVAALLVSGPVRWAALGAVGLTSVFHLALGIRALRGDLGRCECLGRWSGRVGWASTARNALLSAGAISVWWWAAAR